MKRLPTARWASVLMFALSALAVGPTANACLPCWDGATIDSDNHLVANSAGVLQVLDGSLIETLSNGHIVVTVEDTERLRAGTNFSFHEQGDSTTLTRASGFTMIVEEGTTFSMELSAAAVNPSGTRVSFPANTHVKWGPRNTEETEPNCVVSNGRLLCEGNDISG